MVGMSDMVALFNPGAWKDKERFKPWGPKEMERFAVVNPQAAQNIQALKNAGTISALGGLGGVGAGAAFFMNRPGTVNGRLFSMALGGCAWGIMGFLVGTNAASLITGTYKINPMKTHAVFTDWWRANGGAVE